MVLTCDGTGLDAPAECKYTKTVGTAYTETTTEHMGVSSEVSAAIQAGMFATMASLGVSSTTSYDWTAASDETMAEEESFEVLAVVPVGKVLYIEQAVGHCNGKTAKTELFKLYHTDGKGRVIEEWYERHFRNGTVIRFS